MSQLQVAVNGEDHVQGPSDARLTLVEYGDYECPHCAMADIIVKRLQKHYGDDLRYVYRNFPLMEIHPNAEPAAEAAEAAAEQGKFWEMHDALFDNQQDLDATLLGGLAQDQGLDARAVQKAVRTHQYAEKIEDEIDGGLRSGVHGTPTFFINGERHEGSFKYEDLLAALDAA